MPNWRKTTHIVAGKDGQINEGMHRIRHALGFSEFLQGPP